jgi:hypothetical protein
MKSLRLSRGPTGAGGGAGLLIVFVLLGFFATNCLCLASYCLGGGRVCAQALV